MKYEVYHARHDIPEKLYTRFEADSDQEAMIKFTEIRCSPNLQWDWIRMVEVIQERQTRGVASHGPND